MVLCRLRDGWGDKQGDKQCYHRYLNLFFLIKRYSPHMGPFYLLLVSIKGIDLYSHLILKSNFWKLKKDLMHYFKNFIFLPPCVLSLCFSAKYLIKWPYLNLIRQGKCWNLIMSWDLTLKCRLVPLVLFFKPKVRPKTLTKITRQLRSCSRKWNS